MSNKRNVTFIGLGTMGYHMAGHLANSCLANVKVYNRTTDKAEQWLAEFDGEIAKTLADAVLDADVIMTCSGRDEDMMEIVFSEDGVCTHLKNGGEAGAVNGVLSVMAGGNKGALDCVTPLIETYSKNISYMGESGYGQLAKMVNQICIAGLLQGLSEGLLFAEAEGMDMDSLLSAISGGAAQSWQMDNRASTMHKREFDFGFAIKWMVKDLGYCLDRAKDNESQLDFTQEVYNRYVNLMGKGHASSDTSSLMTYNELNK
jgi:3-hydroxyisobutyrate dehydrogenase-like beta-hydroxyacid dehydrogenase